MIPSPEAVVFDFDGVILESTPIKTEAFLELFSPWPEHRQAILGHHRAHLGVSRIRKFEWVYRELLQRDLTAEESQRLGREFSRLVLDRMLTCPFVPGVRQLLALFEGRLPSFVASGTPQEELETIIDRRGLAPYFAEIHGTPSEKAEIVAGIVDRHGFRRDRVWMIGDGISDQEAAAAAGVRFVAREVPGEPPTAWREPVDRVRDLAELRRRWEAAVLSTTS